MSKSSLLTASLLACLFAAAAGAEERPFSPAMTCKSLEALVRSNGAVVISTSRSTYDRYVDSGRFCERTQETRAAWVRSSDKADCFVGYTCREFDRGGR